MSFFMMLFLSLHYQIIAKTNENQQLVIDQLKNERNVNYTVNSTQKLNKKMQIDDYPDNQIECQEQNICKICNTKIGYDINKTNIYLIGLHYGYKQEIIDLFEKIYLIDNIGHYLFFFSNNFICILIKNRYTQQNLQNIIENYNQNITIINIPEFIQLEQNIILNEIILITTFINQKWMFQINKMKFDCFCNSLIFLCQQCEFQIDYFFQIKGIIKENNQVIIEMKYSNQKNITKLNNVILPAQYFQNIIEIYFGERFIEEIEYELNETYTISIQEIKQKDEYEISILFEKYF